MFIIERASVRAIVFFAALIGLLAGASRPAPAAALAEPPVIASSDGILDIMMIAQPVLLEPKVFGAQGINAWSYTVCKIADRGVDLKTNSCPSGAYNNYGGVRLALQPGDLLKIRLVNKLPSLWNPSNGTTSRCLPPNVKTTSTSPAQPGTILESSLPDVSQTLDHFCDDPLLALNPTNIHPHGLIVPANGKTKNNPTYGDYIFTSLFNSANGQPVDLSAETAASLQHMSIDLNLDVAQYEIRIPKTHPPGANWIHPHVHGITVNQVAAGLADIISIGEVDSYLFHDARHLKGMSRQSMRYLVLKDMQLAADGKGGYSPQFQEDPAFCAVKNSSVNPTPNTPAHDGYCLTDASDQPGRWQFTINGQLYPDIPVASADGEIWRFTNASPTATYRLQLMVTDPGASQARPMVFQLTSLDGVPLDGAANATPGQTVMIAGNRIKLVSCGTNVETDGARPVCVSEVVMMSGTRVEMHVAYRDASGNRVEISQPVAGQLLTSGFFTGATEGANANQAGDNWPAVNLASFTLPPGRPAGSGAVHVAGRGGFASVSPNLAPDESAIAPLPRNCEPLPRGYKRRIYLGNPGTGTDQYGTSTFGTAYEIIDRNGNFVSSVDTNGAVTNTAPTEFSAFNPAQAICVPLPDGKPEVRETWELINLTTELHNFHIHQAKFVEIQPQRGSAEDSVPLLPAIAHEGTRPTLPNSNNPSCTIADFKATPPRCDVSPVTVEIPFKELGTFVYHCHILEHEDGGMMQPVKVVPAPAAP